MRKRTGAPEFMRWADTVLAGTGWTARTVREAAEHERVDLATAALADGFAAAARGLSAATEGVDGAA